MATTTERIPILIVDDDPSVGAWLQLLIRRMGDSLPSVVTWVTSGADAMAELNANVYELMLLDYRLQDTDGLSLLTQVQQLPASRQPAVIMLTGGGSEEIAVEAMKRGARDYLIKGSLDQATMRRAMSGALERRRLENELARYTEELRQKNGQMEAELAMAREVQQALLPQQYPTIPRGVSPENSAIRFAHRWIPSSAMAGDFFEVFEISDTSVGLFLCDVMGHGVRAALVTALMRGLLEEMTPYAMDPGAFLHGLNDHLKTILQRTDNILFATAIYLVADTAKGEIRYANAAHPLPLLIRRGEMKAQYLQGEQGPDPALGLIPGTDYATQTIKMSSGDSLILYTDGLFEAENKDGEAYGLERLQQITQGQIGKAAPELFTAMLGDLRGFLEVDNAASLTDDICVISVEFA